MIFKLLFILVRKLIDGQTFCFNKTEESKIYFAHQKSNFVSKKA